MKTLPVMFLSICWIAFGPTPSQAKDSPGSAEADPSMKLAFALISGSGRDRLVLAEDDSADPAYATGWKSEGGGTGFGNWTFQTAVAGNGETFAGFFIGNRDSNSDMARAAIRSKAFGLFANGIGFEVATAFRPLKKPLMAGQTFSFLMKHGPFEKKSDADDTASASIGLTLRNGNASGGIDDYNKGVRFEFGCYVDQKNYQIYDGGSEHDTGIPLTDAGLSVSLTMVTADTYDLEITTLADKKTITLEGRKLGGDAGGKIESFCIFDRNGEKNDGFFNGFQVLGEVK